MGIDRVLLKIIQHTYLSPSSACLVTESAGKTKRTLKSYLYTFMMRNKTELLKLLILFIYDYRTINDAFMSEHFCILNENCWYMSTIIKTK